MKPKDTSQTGYAVAFNGDRFLMVWNIKRNGWEMPGGHIQENESVEEGIRREFIEESGYDIQIVSTRDIGTCFVCAAILGKKISDSEEMKVGFFEEIPDQLSFDRDEYEDTLPWALGEIRAKS